MSERWRNSVEEKGLRGFTLIELLVVIAIIAVLAAILFPVFVRAKDSSTISVCLSNMKQFGSAIKLYEQDYYGRIFGPSYPYGGAPGQGDVNATLVVNAYKGYTKNLKVFQCPADKFFGFKMPKPPAAGSQWYFPNTISYAYNGWTDWATGRGEPFVPRDLSTESGINPRSFRSQVGWVVTDMRYLPPGYPPNRNDPFEYNLMNSWTRTAHSDLVQFTGQSYIQGLRTIRLYPDMHARFCKGWQRFLPDLGSGIPDDMP